MADEEVTLRVSGDASPLNAAIADSQTKVKALATDLASGGGNVEKTFTDATKSIANLNLELAKGGKLSDEQAAAIGQLAGQYTELAVEAAKGGESAEEAGKKVEGGAIRGITSMGRLDMALEKSGGSFAKWAGGALAAFETFEFGWREGEKLKKKLDEFSDGKFSAAIDDWVEHSDVLRDTLHFMGVEEETAAEKSKTFLNDLNILRHNGIDPAGLSVEEVSAKVQDLGVHMRDTSSAFTEANAKIDEGDKTLRLYVETAEHGGEISTAQADKIVADSERQLKAIEELPADERKAQEQRIKDYQGFIDQYKGATTEFIANTEREAKAAADAANKEVDALKKVQDALDKKNLALLQKNVDVAQKALDGPSDKSITNTRDLTREADKLKGKIAEINAQPMLSIEDENLLDGYRASLSDLNRKLKDGAQSFGEIDKAANDAQSRLSDLRDAEFDLGQAQQDQSDKNFKAVDGLSRSKVVINETTQIVKDFGGAQREAALAGGIFADAQEHLDDVGHTITQTYNEEDEALRVANASKKEAADDTKALADLQEHYGVKSKETGEIIDKHLNPALGGTVDHVRTLKSELPELISLFHELANVGSGGGQGGGF